MYRIRRGSGTAPLPWTVPACAILIIGGPTHGGDETGVEQAFAWCFACTTADVDGRLTIFDGRF